MVLVFITVKSLLGRGSVAFVHHIYRYMVTYLGVTITQMFWPLKLLVWYSY